MCFLLFLFSSRFSISLHSYIEEKQNTMQKRKETDTLFDTIDQRVTKVLSHRQGMLHFTEEEVKYLNRMAEETNGNTATETL